MKNFGGIKICLYLPLNTKIRLTLLCLSGFELYSRWVPLSTDQRVLSNTRITRNQYKKSWLNSLRLIRLKSCFYHRGDRSKIVYSRTLFIKGSVLSPSTNVTVQFYKAGFLLFTFKNLNLFLQYTVNTSPATVAEKAMWRIVMHNYIDHL